MALIQCSKCGKQISDKAKKCPHCGANNKISNNKKSNKKILFIVIFILLIVLVGSLFTYHLIKNNNNKDLNITNSKTANDKTYSSFFPYPSIDNKKQLNDVIKNGKVILFIAQSSCRYCKQFSPTVDDLANNYNLKVYLIMIDKIDFNNLINDNSDFSNFFNTNDDWGTPTLLLYDNGKLINSTIGLISYEELEAKLSENNFI